MNLKVATFLSLVLGTGIGVLGTVLYYQNLPRDLSASSSVVVDSVASNDTAGLRHANTTEVAGPSAATVAKMREVEELILNSNGEAVVAQPIAPAKSYSASESMPIEPAPVDPPVFSERDRQQQQAALSSSRPREIGEFIEVDSPPFENGLHSSKKMTPEQIGNVSETVAQ